MSTLRLTADRATFAAERRGAAESADAQFEPLVRSGLARYGSDDQWYDGVRDAALALWDATAQLEFPDPSPVIDAVREEFADLLASTLAQTTEPSTPPTDAEVTRLVSWLSTFTLNSASMAAAMAEGEDATLEWVSMRDDDVRDSHREADGQVVPVGGTFEVDGYELHHPGEPVGPPAIWIRCRCMARPGIRGEFSMGTITAATEPEEVEEVEEDVDPDDLTGIAPEAWDDLESDVPWHGVLAPIGVMSGDKRMLSENARFRDLPLPIKYMPQDQPGHDGSVVVANLERAWIEDGLIKGEGTFRGDDSYAADAIALVAEKMLRGLSVDLDDAVAELQNEDGSPYDMDDEANFAPGAPQPVTVVTDYRVASATICAIPAFQEAFIALGPWADDAATEEVAPEPDETLTASCAPCEATTLLEAAGAPADHIATLLALFPTTLGANGDHEIDGVTYHFANGSLQVFAPGTRDGPGWITNPDDTQRLRNYWVKGKGAAKIRWGQPGDFNRCRKQLAKYVPNPNHLAGTCANLHKEAIKIWPGEHRGGSHSAVTASAGPAFSIVASIGAVPVEWFGDPHLTEPTPITITDDGRVFGHVATWDSCHIGPQYAGMCQAPPRSNTSYADFHQGGTVLTTSGPLRIGHITYGIGHADPRKNALAAMRHYDDATAKMAQVRAGEDDIGIWVAGVCKPGMTDEEKYNFRASALSGDWRDTRGTGELEMIAALSVNVPGFPQQATTLAASAGQPSALIAAGVVKRSPAAQFSQEAIAAIVRTTMAETRAAERREARAAEVRARLRADRLAVARERLK